MHAKSFLLAAIAAGSLTPIVFAGGDDDEQQIKIFKETLDRLDHPFDEGRFATLRAAAQTNAFTCEQVVQFINKFQWKKDAALHVVEIFTGPENERLSAILDPENKQVILDVFSDNKFMGYCRDTAGKLLKDLEASKNKGGLPPAFILPQSGIRSTDQMTTLTEAIKSAGMRDDDKLKVLQGEVKENTEQFTGPQILQIVALFTFSGGGVEAIKTLEMLMTGVTCDEVVDILTRGHMRAEDQFKILESLKTNIVDGQYKLRIVDSFTFQSDKTEAEKVLRDVGANIPPKNNPVFGIVEGDPVVFVIDKSGSMATTFSLGTEKFSRDSFCDRELMVVLRALNPDSRFNIIVYGTGAEKIFPDVVQATPANIETAITKATGKGPNMGSTNSLMALKLAYGMTTRPTKIYMMTDGAPNDRAATIISEVQRMDPEHKIPVNAIAFLMPTPNDDGESAAKSFMKELAQKTGGFYRAVGPASERALFV